MTSSRGLGSVLSVSSFSMTSDFECVSQRESQERQRASPTHQAHYGHTKATLKRHLPNIAAQAKPNISRAAYESAEAATAEYHRLGGLDTGTYFLAVLEAEVQDQG